MITEIPHTRSECRVFAWIEDGAALGVLAIDADFDQVVFVGVQPDHRRRGIATALLATARETTGLTLDMDDGARSGNGHAFGQAVGLKRGFPRTRVNQREMEAKTDEWLQAVEAALS